VQTIVAIGLVVTYSLYHPMAVTVSLAASRCLRVAVAAGPVEPWRAVSTVGKALIQ